MFCLSEIMRKNPLPLTLYLKNKIKWRDLNTQFTEQKIFHYLILFITEPLIVDYVTSWCKTNGYDKPAEQQLNDAKTERISYARKQLRPKQNNK